MSKTKRARLLLWSIVPLLGAGYQIAAKEAADGIAGARLNALWLPHLLHQPWTWVMLAFELASFFAWMPVLAQIQLSEAFPLSALSYVLVVAAAWTVFHEPLDALQVVGGVTILVGIWLIGRPAQQRAETRAT